MYVRVVCEAVAVHAPELVGDYRSPFTDAVRAVRLGAKLEEGIVRWSNQTDRRALDLITAQTTDAVATFLDTAYVARYLERLAAKAATPVADPEARVAEVSKALKFTEQQRKAILSDFLQAGDITASGIMQAVTSVAERAEADTAYEMEATACRALELAAT
jgi:hypothetical protein